MRVCERLVVSREHTLDGLLLFMYACIYFPKCKKGHFSYFGGLYLMLRVTNG